MVNPIPVYISYAHQDEELLDDLETYLRPLINRGQISLWDSRKIAPGALVMDEINTHLKAARIVLLLISPNYLAAKHYSNEITLIMERMRIGKVPVIPILLSAIHWKDEPYGHLSPLPDNGEPVKSWRDKGRAFFNIAEGIGKVLEGVDKRGVEVEEQKLGRKDTPMEDVVNMSFDPFIAQRIKRLEDRRQLLLNRQKDLQERLAFLYKELDKTMNALNRFELQKAIEQAEKGELALVEQELENIEQQIRELRERWD